LTNIDYIPSWLKQYGAFCLWRYEDKDGRKTKIPYNPHSPQSRARVNDRATFSDLQTALTASNCFDGLGVGVFDAVCGIDIDHCITPDGQLSPIAADIIETVDSYTEISPSGSGIRILCLASCLYFDTGKYYVKQSDVKINGQSTGIGLEIYVAGQTKRFLTVTGNTIRCMDMIDRSDSVLKVIEKYMLRPMQAAQMLTDTSPASAVDDIPDNDLLTIAARAADGARFCALWNGDTSAYGSQSEADLALCNILAFWTGKNAERMDRLFRLSGLMRDKWDRQQSGTTYGAITIANAIAACYSVYDPNYQSENLPLFMYKKDKGGFAVDRPRLAQYIRDNEHYFFLQTGGDKPLLFSYDRVRGVYEQLSENAFRGIIKRPIEEYNAGCVKMSDIDETFRLLVTDGDIYRDVKELDRTENLINFKNGLLDVNTMQLYAHSPDIISTVQLPCEWSPYAAEKPIFDSFLNSLSSGNEDIKRLLMQFIGLVISNIRGTVDKSALFLVGKGNTGKSQFLGLLSRLIGQQNFASVDLGQLEERFGKSAIWRKRLAGSPDLSAMTVRELKTFKQLTGGDPVDIEFKGRDKFSDTYRGAFLFCGNELPRFGGDRGGQVYERMVIVPCNNVVAKQQRDPYLLDRMAGEYPAIVCAAVYALQEFVNNGFHFDVPEICLTARSDYEVANDNVLMWLSECTEIPEDKTRRLITSKAYSSYTAWCKANNEYAFKKVDFQKSLCRRYNADDIRQLRTKTNGNYYYPFGLNPEAQQLFGF